MNRKYPIGIQSFENIRGSDGKVLLLEPSSPFWKESVAFNLAGLL